MKVLYTAEAFASGDGRNGHVRTSDGAIDSDLQTPVELGGAGGGPNPETLFASGYAACFHGSVRLAARMRSVALGASEVRVAIDLGADDDGSYALGATVEVQLPGVDDEVARDLVEAAHRICPYSRAVRGNVEVVVSLR